MVSAFMPDVVVEIAFNAGYTTASASRTWTDVSSYVELADRIAISVGRQDERSTADANSLTLTFDNTDGRFTAGRAASPYYPNVKIGRPIRVKVTPPGGTTVTRFVGFVDEWPVEWDGSDAYARATVRASSRMARLGLSAKLRSAIEQEVIAASPLAYYTLGDPSGSTLASESSGSGLATPLAATGTGVAVSFGNATGPDRDGLTAAAFDAGQYLAGSFGGGSVVNAVRFTLLVSASSTGAVLFGQGTPVLSIDAGGTLALAVGTSTLPIGPVVTDGLTHDIILSYSGGTATLYVDGASSSMAATASPVGTFWIGQGLHGVMSHVALYGAALTPTQVSSQNSAVTSAFAGDRTDVRLLRLLEWVGVASAEVDVETGSETMTHQQTSGQSVTDALRDVESTEGGVLFDGPDGDVKFHNRAHRYLATAVATLNMASQHVGSDYAPKLDRSTLVNDVTVENPVTGFAVRQVDTTSRDEYGVATASVTSLAQLDADYPPRASWVIASYAEPRNRVPSLTVDVLAHQGLTPSAQTLLGVTVSDLLAVTNAPTQSDTTSPSYFVEGYTETIGPESYSITFNLSPTYPTLNTLVLDSATRGLLDTGLLAL